MKIKESKKLTDLMDQIAELSSDDYDFDFVGEFDADCYAMENEDKCRSDHFDSHIMDGVALVEKSIKTKKPIYRVYSKQNDIVFYFANDIVSLQKKFKTILKGVEEMNAADEYDEIEELETRLASLKKKKK